MGTTNSNASIVIRIALWVAQVLLFVPFVMFGLMKVLKPIAELSLAMPWAGQLPAALVRFTGVVDVAGGIGILLPAVTRIRPELGIWAARGIIVLQILAIGFHGLRGEFPMLPLNFVLLALAIFVLWGRSRKAPITAR
jgi:uncharacterized membrane protein YphA (DoxX/SURF4 family)